MPSLEQIETLLESEPEDVFLHYCRAMELAKVDRVDDALASFDRTLELDANYCAAYFHKGQTLIAAGRLDDARGVLSHGRSVAEATGDNHTRDEIAGLLETII
jgi:predicted Zn-dependent protease